MAENKMVSHQEFMKDEYFRTWYPKWINNAMENYPVIKEDFSKKNCCITVLPRPMNRPCIVTGAGPSFDEHATKLKDWKNPIFTGSSMALSLMKNGRDPEYICAFDSLHETWNQIKGHEWKNSTLLTHPNAEPAMIAKWRWPKYYYRRVFPGHEFFELTFPLMFPWIKLGFLFTGSVVNNAASIAAFLGYNPIYLLGVDYGWKNREKTRCDNYKMDGKDLVKNPIAKEPDNTPIVEVNGTRTAANHYSFKEGLLGVISQELGNITFVDCSDGIISELPKDNFDNVLAKQGYIAYDTSPEITRNKIKNFFEVERVNTNKQFDEISKGIKK